MALGIGTMLCSLSLLALLLVQESNAGMVYMIAGLVGLSQPYILSTGLNFISDVVGERGKTGAFVFGVYGLGDKVSAGLVVAFVGSTSAYTK
jgi:hypothetical protein